MATGGWGAIGNTQGGGAWGGAYQKPVEATEDIDLHGPSVSGYDQNATYGGAAATKASSYGGERQPSGRVQNSYQHYTQEEAVGMPEVVVDERTKILDTSTSAPGGGGGAPRKNWPFACWPWLYHDIAADIPEGRPRRIVKIGYGTWWGLVACMLWNFVCASFMLPKSVPYKIGSWFLAMTYAVLGIPLGFMFWYRPLYRGCKNDSSVSMLAFYIVYGIHCCFCVWAAIAIPFRAEYWSLAGFGSAFKAADVSGICGTVYFIGAAMWTLESLVSLWLLKDVVMRARGK